MNNNQARIAQAFGYKVEEVPGLRQLPKATYYNKAGEALANLPADPYHMRRYLARGLRLSLDAPVPVAKAEEKPPLYESEKPKQTKVKRKYTRRTK